MAPAFSARSVSEWQQSRRRRLCCWNFGLNALTLVVRLLLHDKSYAAPQRIGGSSSICRLSLDGLCRYQQRLGCTEA